MSTQHTDAGYEAGLEAGRREGKRQREALVAALRQMLETHEPKTSRQMGRQTIAQTRAILAAHAALAAAQEK